MWVDATGKSFAAYDNQAAILVINGKITYTTSMYYTCASMSGPPYCDGQPASAAAATWAPFTGVYYAGDDCTGQAYISGFALGFAQYATPLVDGTDNQTYLYIGDAAQVSPIVIRSAYANKQCFAQPTFSVSLAPVVAVIPAAAIATPPFSLK